MQGLRNPNCLAILENFIVLGKKSVYLFRDVLQMGGTAMDSVIASLFCNGVYNSQSMGIGGGFLMTYYNAKVNLFLYVLETG